MFTFEEFHELRQLADSGFLSCCVQTIPGQFPETALRLAFGSAFLVQFLDCLPMLSPIVDVTFDF